MADRRGSPSPTAVSKKARKSGEDSIVDSIAEEVQAAQGISQREHMDFVWKHMEVDKSGETSRTIAGMLKKGTIRQAIAQAQAVQVALHRPEFGPMIKVPNLRSLEGAQLDKLLGMFEPTIFTEEALATLSRTTKMGYICFGLGQGQGKGWPAMHAALSWETPLFTYLNIHYQALGRRLCLLDVATGKRRSEEEGGDPEPMGYLRRDGASLCLAVPLKGGASNTEVNMPILATADDLGAQEQLVLGKHSVDIGVPRHHSASALQEVRE